MLALDLDGTTLNEEKVISNENRKWIKTAEEYGIKVVFATGRGASSTSQYMQELGLHGPMVTVNGSEVWLKPGELLDRQCLDAEMLKLLHKLALEYGASFWVNAVEGIFRDELWPADYTHRCMKFGIVTSNGGHLQQIKSLLESTGKVELTSSHPHNVEINPAGVHKARGIRLLCEQYGITMRDVVAVGDHTNDLHLIREAGLGVAMGNAEKAVMLAADYITDTNENNGVARIIRELLHRSEAG
jgi:hydroxymethylpyrimidine pyrophosphatase-like HAD family hydrolase